MNNLKESFRSYIGLEKSYLDAWVDEGYLTEETMRYMMDSGCERRALFDYVVSKTPFSKSLIEFVKVNGSSVLVPYSASADAVKNLAHCDFLLLAGKACPYGERYRLYSYLVLKYSSSKAEHEYISKVGGMRHVHRYNSQKYGGKLYRMAAPYLTHISEAINLAA